MSARIDAREVFASFHPGPCCECAADIGFMGDGWAPQDRLYLVKIGGVDCISDRYVSIRADLLDMSEIKDAHIIDIRNDRPGVEYTIPDVKPGPSTRPLRMSQADRLTRAGFTIHHADDDAQPVYYGDEWAGAVMPMKADDRQAMPTLADLPLIQRIVSGTIDRGGEAAFGMNFDTHEPWADAAASVLMIAKELHAAGLLDGRPVLRQPEGPTP